MSRSRMKNALMVAAATSTASAAAVAGVVGSTYAPPKPIHDVTTMAARADAIRTIMADPVLMALIDFMLPGTSGTKPGGTPGTAADLGWLDHGVWNQLPTRILLDDSSQYPAVLGEGGNGQVSGEQSMLMGADYFVRSAGQYDPKTTVYMGEGGSQGSMALRWALIAMVAQGIPADQLFGVMYSDPYTEGTSIAARFGQGQDIPTTGIKGGVPDVPAGVNALSISYRYDPMAHMVKYLWTLPFTGLNNLLGFVFEHPDLNNIDYGDPGNVVTRDGNVTYINLAPKIIPILMPIVFAGYLAGIPTNITSSILKPLDDVLRPIMDMGGGDVKGGFEFAPPPDVFAGQVVKVLQGVVNAMTDTVKLVTGQPVFVSNPVPSPVQQLIDQAKAKDAELNGTGSASTQSSTSAVAPTSATLPTTTPTPQAVPEVKVSLSTQTPSPATVPALTALTAVPPQASQSPEKPAVDDSKDKASGTPAPSPSITPSVQPSVTNTTPPTGSPAAEPQQKDQKDTKPDTSKGTPKDETNAPKVTAPPKSDHPKGDVNSASDVMKSGNPAQKHDQKGDDQGSGPKSGGTNSSTPHTAASDSSSKDSDSSGSKASAHAGGGESHSTS